MSKPRWYVIRPFKLNTGDVAAGKYLTPSQEQEIPVHLFRTLVRGVRLYDMEGTTDNAWSERNKHKLRLKALSDIGTPEADSIRDLIIHRLANSRVIEFGGVREKALAKEIKASIPEPVKEDEPISEDPIAIETVEPEESEGSSAIDDLLDGQGEDLPVTRAKTVRRRRKN